MKGKVKNIKASVYAKLRNKAKEANKPFAEILQYYAMERFLYRLTKSKYSSSFILKGALMFSIWKIPERRSTVDIDIEGYFDNDIITVENLVKEVCTISVEDDGLVFSPDTVKGEIIKKESDYKGIRVRFIGFLDRSKIFMQIDIAFGDSVYPAPKEMEFPVMLGMQKPKLKGYPIESVISEKLEAIIKLGAVNSRMKDFYDIWIISKNFDLSGKILIKSILKTFEHRKTPLPNTRPFFDREIYNSKSDRQTLWKAFINKNEFANVPKELNMIALEIEDFLIEPLGSLNQDFEFTKKWDPEKIFWR